MCSTGLSDAILNWWQCVCVFALCFQAVKDRFWARRFLLRLWLFLLDWPESSFAQKGLPYLILPVDSNELGGIKNTLHNYVFNSPIHQSLVKHILSWLHLLFKFKKWTIVQEWEQRLSKERTKSQHPQKGRYNKLVKLKEESYKI